MRNLYAPGDLAQFEPGDHISLIYDNDQDQKNWSITCARKALNQHEKMLYLIDPSQMEGTMSALWDAGLGLEALLQAGQLQIRCLSSVQGQDDKLVHPDNIQQILHDELEIAREQGFETLQIMAEMSWAVECSPVSEVVEHYETAIFQFITQNPAVVMCQYDRHKFQPDTLLGLLTSHPYLALGETVYENFYYLHGQPRHLAADYPEVVFDTWLRNLRDYHTSQEKMWHSSTHDVETGLFNRAFFDEEMAQLEKDPSHSIGMVMVLLDHPELLLEGFDPQVAREYLRRAAQVLKTASRQSDVIARVDERQFAVLTRDGDFQSMEDTVRRIRSALKSHNQDIHRAPLNLFLWGATSRMEQ